MPRWFDACCVVLGLANVAGVVFVLVLVLVLGGCSTVADRMDDRPALCRDLGKRGAEC